MGKGREDALRAHQSGAARVIVNNGVLTKGYNDKRIDLISEMRLTNSPGLLVQMRGRGTRTLQGKENCLVLDFAGNTKRCGPFNDPYIPKARGPAGGDAPVRICDGCGAYHHASVRVCDVCGFEFPREEKLTGRASTETIMVEAEPPKYEWFNVRTVAYTLHRKNGRPNCLRASYYGLAQKFDAYHHFDAEHEHPRHEARKWWRSRTGIPENTPESVHEALARTNELPTPARILVWVNTRYKEIVGYE
jgi:DNA repair protein RadD